MYSTLKHCQIFVSIIVCLDNRSYTLLIVSVKCSFLLMRILNVSFITGRRQLIRMLQQHRSTSASGRLLPSNWSEASVPPVLYEPTSLISDKQGGVPRAASLTTGGYLKSWLSRLDVSGPGFKASSDSNKHVVVADSSKRSQTDESIDFAKYVPAGLTAPCWILSTLGSCS